MGTGPKVYVASKVKHYGVWKTLRAEGLNVVSSWIDAAALPTEGKDFPRLWLSFIAEAAWADALLLYCEPGEVMKGALVEVGAALCAGNRVFIVGEPEGSWVNHPLVTRCETIHEAVRLIKDLPCT